MRVVVAKEAVRLLNLTTRSVPWALRTLSGYTLCLSPLPHMLWRGAVVHPSGG